MEKYSLKDMLRLNTCFDPTNVYIGQGPGLQSFHKVKVNLTLRSEISNVVFYTLY